MKSVICVVALAAAATALAGCATITRGTTTDFKVSSTPPGAAVATSTGFSCSPTPCTISKMIRKEPFDVTVTLAGYEPKKAHIQSLVEGGGAAGAVGNVVVGGVIGVAVDASDGAMDDLVPNPLHVDLVSATPPPPSAAAPAAPVAASPAAAAITAAP